MSVLSTLVASLADALHPFFADSATAAAIVVCTLLVRFALHPLARRAARGERARAELAPAMAELRRKHRRNPERMNRALAELHREHGVSPVTGCLPMLLQLPVFFVMYHLFTTDGGLLHHALLGAPLGGDWTDALHAGGLAGPHGLVYLGLFAVIAAMAGWTALRARRAVPAAGAPAAANSPAAPGMAAMARLTPWLSFGSLVTAAVMPLAAGLYVATTTTWTAAERAWLHRGWERDRERTVVAARPTS
jgi:YidC/Oxa1 family membrane protein insertase